MEGLPPSMFEFMKVPGIGAKTGYRLAKELKLKNLKDLKEAARKGKIATLPGFGEESEKDIIKGIEELNIGYSIVCRAVLVGLERAVKEMKALMQ